MSELSELITLEVAREIFPGNPTRRTLLNRIKQGVNGVKLKAIFSGRWFTSQAWIEDFLEQTTRTALPSTMGRPRLATARSAKLRKDLARYGITSEETVEGKEGR